MSSSRPLTSRSNLSTPSKSSQASQKQSYLNGDKLEPALHHPPSRPYMEYQLENWERDIMSQFQKGCLNPKQEYFHSWSFEMVDRKFRMLQLKWVDNYFVSEWQSYYYTQLESWFQVASQTRPSKTSELEDYCSQSYGSSRATSRATSAGSIRDVTPSIRSEASEYADTHSYASATLGPYYDPSHYPIPPFVGENESAGAMPNADFYSKYDPDVIYGATLLCNLKARCKTNYN